MAPGLQEPDGVILSQRGRWFSGKKLSELIVRGRGDYSEPAHDKLWDSIVRGTGC